MKKIMNRICLKQDVIYFCIIFTFFLIMQGVYHIDHWQFDSDEYWNLGKSMWISHDKWSIYGLQSGFRGYVFPLFLSICYKLGRLFKNEFVGFWIISSLVFAFLFSYLQNTIALCLKMKQKNKYYGIIIAVLSFFFFKGLFLYPLSDIYSFMLCIFSAVILYKINTYGRFSKMIAFVLLGILLYAEYNIRTIYLFPAILVALLSLCVGEKQIHFKNLAVRMVFLCSGIGIGALPQILLNRHLSGNYSMKVPTNHLMLSQVYWGMKYNRYEAYIGNPKEFDTVQVYFMDKVGNYILGREGIEKAFGSFGQYFQVILKYPMDVAGMFVRHLANALYPVFPEVYISNMHSFKGFYLLVFFTILFITIVYVMNRKFYMQEIVTMIILLLSCLFILPGAVEVRFFYPLYFLVFIFAIYGFKEFVNIVKGKIIRYCILYLIGFGVYLAGCGYMLCCIENAKILM